MKNKVVYIHIGKTGGTSIRSAMPNHIKTVHMSKPSFQNDCSYVIWVRNPLRRFVSAFRHSASLINFNAPTNCKFGDLYHDSTTPYYMLTNKIKSKLRFDNPFLKEPARLRCDGRRYVELIKFFETPNKLAESLSNEDIEVRDMAFELMGCECEHINKGIGWYLDNGDFVEKYHENILMVGRTEYMDEDIEKLSIILNKGLGIKRERAGNYRSEKYLSDMAIENLLHYYKNTDYTTLDVLHKYNFIDKKTLKEYEFGE